jgi:hypothetical protein
MGSDEGSITFVDLISKFGFSGPIMVMRVMTLVPTLRVGMPAPTLRVVGQKL